MSKTRELPPPPPHRPLFKHHSWSPDMLREEIWRRRQSQKPNHSRGGSLSDDDLDELKACIDLGFGFDSVDVDPKLSDTFPALELYYAVNKRYANSLSRSSSFSSIVSESDDGNPSTIFDSGEDSQTVKTKLKQWAKIVSCSTIDVIGIHCTRPKDPSSHSASLSLPPSSFANVDELRQKLLYTSFELESLKMEATEEIRNSKEKVKNSLNLLKMAYTERDEARNQLQILMNRFLYSSNVEILTHLPHLQSASPLVITTEANSSITESNSLSHNSLADSFFDTVSSPDLSNVNMEDSNKTSVVNQQFLIDPSLQMIERIVKEKPLPQKGNRRR